MPGIAASQIVAPHALLPGGWASDVLLAWNDAGMLTRVAPGTAHAGAGVARTAGSVVPGLPNLHSHAFQRAFAGLAEDRAAAAADSFWTWRDLMYRFALAISPEELEAVATQLYIEMLKGGYTAVCEFHYLHHDRSGASYADPAEMAWRLVAAAEHAGIGLTLLPVLYQHGGFGARAPRVEQRRFVHSAEGVLDIAARLRKACVRTGVAPHSLRAVAPAALAELLAGVRAVDAAAPIHIHVAEQEDEVRDCIGWCGRRPVQWLLDHAPVDARWCLVHATHLDAAERRGLASSGAVAGLCPSTEANLGDGVFDAAGHVTAGGAWGIGSDSHVSVDAAGELRLLEYGQRLVLRRRHVLGDGAFGGGAGAGMATGTGSAATAGAGPFGLAESLWLSAVAGGAQAAGRAPGTAPTGAGGSAVPRSVVGLAVGQRADFVVLDSGPLGAGLSPSQLLASHVFAASGSGMVRDVWALGRRRIVDRRHALDDAAATSFAAARSQLLNEA